MRRALFRAAVLAGLAASAGCFLPPSQSEEQYDPFVAPTDTVLNLVDAIVVTPVVPPEGVFVSPAASQLITGAIETRLSQGGITVVPAAEYTRIWDGIIRQLGGFFDPLTGEREEWKFQAARRELMRELQGRYRTRVLLYAELHVLDAYVDGGIVEWDGAEQDIRGHGEPIDARYQETFQQDELAGSRDGVVSVVSLAAAIDGPDGREIYRNFGGLEVVGRRQGTVVDVEGDFVLEAQWERVVHAVDRALSPLVERLAGSGGGN
jgi:hypothetical protein